MNEVHADAGKAIRTHSAELSIRFDSHTRQHVSCAINRAHCSVLFSYFFFLRSPLYCFKRPFPSAHCEANARAYFSCTLGVRPGRIKSVTNDDVHYDQRHLRITTYVADSIRCHYGHIRAHKHGRTHTASGLGPVCLFGHSMLCAGCV